MTSRIRRRTFTWNVASIVVGTLLFLSALSTDLYNVTSPPDFVPHVILRKVYSVGAFALVVYLVGRASAQRGKPISVRMAIVIGAAYSGAIEIGQYFSGSVEGLGWNAFDVACGAIGGLLAALYLRMQARPPREKKSRLLKRTRAPYETARRPRIR